MTSQGNLPDWQKEWLNFAADYLDAVHLSDLWQGR